MKKENLLAEKRARKKMVEIQGKVLDQKKMELFEQLKITAKEFARLNAGTMTAEVIDGYRGNIKIHFASGGFTVEKTAADKQMFMDLFGISDFYSTDCNEDRSLDLFFAYDLDS